VISSVIYRSNFQRETSLELTDVTRMWEALTFNITGTRIEVFIVTSINFSCASCSNETWKVCELRNG
jgi:hypothetical protein